MHQRGEPTGPLWPGVEGPPSNSFILEPDPSLEPLDPKALFPTPRPFEVELGSGDGSFTLRYARLCPQRNLLAIERRNGRVAKVDRKAQRAGLDNLRILQLDASFVVGYLLLPATVDAFHIYYPDPWPKRRHRKHRLIHWTFVGAIARDLVPGGHVYIRTDSRDYLRQIMAAFSEHTCFREVETPPHLSALSTDFEEDFRAQGVPIYRLAYQRVRPPQMSIVGPSSSDLERLEER